MSTFEEGIHGKETHAADAPSPARKELEPEARDVRLALVIFSVGIRGEMKSFMSWALLRQCLAG